MIHATLKERTRACHSALESKLRVLLSNDITLSQYASVQKSFYGFYKPIESRLVSVNGWPDPSFDVKNRLKCPLLVRDLISLAVDPDELDRLPNCQILPQLKTVPEALGCLYVLEGSTLGGKIITSHLKRVLPIDEARGCSFFSSYGDDVGRMWSSFLGILERYCEQHGGSDDVVRSACDTFASLDRWVSHGIQVAI